MSCSPPERSLLLIFSFGGRWAGRESVTCYFDQVVIKMDVLCAEPEDDDLLVSGKSVDVVTL